MTLVVLRIATWTKRACEVARLRLSGFFPRPFRNFELNMIMTAFACSWILSLVQVDDLWYYYGCWGPQFMLVRVLEIQGVQGPGF